MSRWVKAAAVAVLMAASPVARAACEVSATAVNFGNYNPLSGTTKYGTGTVTATCSGLLVLSLFMQFKLSAGASGSYVNRHMVSSGPVPLLYNLYTDAAYSKVWGDGSGGTDSNSILLNLVLLGTGSHSFTVYGRLPGGQNVPPGTYSDTIVATVEF
jgi:spore coat protein U-like protein